MTGWNAVVFTAMLSACCVSAPLQAADPLPTTEASMLVSANVIPGCLISNATAVGSIETTLENRSDIHWGSINFGALPAAGNTGQADAALTWDSTVRVACTPGITLSMKVDSGLNASSGTRQLKDSATSRTLQYYLYSSASRDAGSVIAIDQSIDLAPFALNYEDIRFPIYARVMLPAVAASGSYTDTVRITLEW